jgi:hypothetical protein
MKALSIRQPWAFSIVHGGKDIENRSWPTRFRGPVLIHAAKGMTYDEYDAWKLTIDAFDLAGPWLEGKTLADLNRGGIIGYAEIVDCVEKHPSPWFFGEYGFVLANVKPLEFVACKGALGFFDPGPLVLADVRAQLA